MSRARDSSVLGTLFRYEIKSLLRDTRTILIAIVAPLILFPAYIFILNFVESRESRALEEATYEYAVTGEREEWARGIVDAAIALDQADPDTTRAPARFESRDVEDPFGALRSGDLHVVVEGLSASQWDSIRRAREAEESAGEERQEGEGDLEEEEAREPDPMVPAIQLHYRGGSDFSRAARNRLTSRIREVRTEQRDSVYRDAGFPVAMEDVARVEDEDVATAAKQAGAFLGVALTPLLVLLMLSGGSIVAVDAISGEKERGTLETLLTTAASRTDIVRAKLLAVIAVGLAVSVINVVNLLVYVVLGLLDLPENFALSVGPTELVLLLLLFVPVAVLVASALLLVSGASSSYKEFQVKFFPVFLAFLVPSLAAGLPGIDLRSVISFIPLAGIAVAVREVLVGKIDVPFLLIAFASTGALAWWLARLTQNTLSNEKLITGSQMDEADLKGGAALFPRHVFAWFVGLWVVFFIVTLWFGEELGLRGQLLVNLVGILFGGSVLIIRHYGLNVKETLSLRAPDPSAWIATLLAAPSGLILVGALGQFINTYIFPVPEEMLEEFSQSLAQPDLGLGQLLLFLCLMPGIFEEIAFRGVLLSGLRQRIRNPWLLALAVGAIFGFFHVSLFRLVPTALLGVFFAWAVLLTGSIYPAMLWHFLNNALAIIPQYLEWLPPDYAPDAWWALPSAAVLGLAFLIMRAGGRSARAVASRATSGNASDTASGTPSRGSSPDQP